MSSSTKNAGEGNTATEAILRKRPFFSHRKNRNFNSGFGSGFRGPNVFLDPSIRALNEERLEALRSGFSEFQTNQRALRSRLEGNQGALLEARTRPITEMVNRNLQGLTRRGLGGSTFFGQAAATGATQIGDARSQAEMETIEALTGIDRGMVQGLFNYASQFGAAAGQRLEAELRALGLSQGMINIMQNSFNRQQERAFNKTHQIAGSILQGFGMANTSKETPQGSEDLGYQGSAANFGQNSNSQFGQFDSQAYYGN